MVGSAQSVGPAQGAKSCSGGGGAANVGFNMNCECNMSYGDENNLRIPPTAANAGCATGNAIGS
jgi:hypothetical protein